MGEREKREIEHMRGETEYTEVGKAVVPDKGWVVESVELLVQQGINEVPKDYVRNPTSEQCNTNIDIHQREDINNEDALDTTKQIPIVDLGVGDDEVIRQVKVACEEWGFFRVVNHGVSEELLDRMLCVAKAFMEGVPVCEKLKYAAEPGALMAEGYGSRYTTREMKVKDWRDYIFLVVQPKSARSYKLWPTEPPSFREILEEYSEATCHLALRLMSIISIGLGLPSTFIQDAIQEPILKVSINLYPRCPQPHLTHGFHQHSDLGALTLVLEDPNGPIGLHIRHKDQWVPIMPTKGSFVVNIADQVEILTNGKYKSIEHRVVPDYHHSRLSVAMFCDATPYAIISPAKELTNTPIYKEIKFLDHETAFFEYGADGKSYIQSCIIPSNA